jgi:hypothetical protein
MKISTEQLKRIIQEELSNFGLETELQWQWPKIKNEFETLAQFKLPNLEYNDKEENKTIEKYPDYFPKKRDRGFVPFRQADTYLAGRGYPSENEKGERGYWDSRQAYPFEWSTEGVRNVWERDIYATVEKYIKKIDKEIRKLDKLIMAIAKKIQTSLKFGGDKRERQMLYAVLADISKTIVNNPPYNAQQDWQSVDKKLLQALRNIQHKLEEAQDLSQTWSKIGK